MDSQDSDVRPFFTSLSCNALRAHVDFETSVELAKEFGFEGIAPPDESYLSELSRDQRQTLKERLVAAGIRWGSVGIRVDLGAGASEYGHQLGQLDAWAEMMASVGVERTHTWIVPMSDDRTYLRNFARHVERISSISEVLTARGLRLGIEYVGQKSTWSKGRFPFIHTLAETKELICAVGCRSVGLVLDTLHWYSSGESVEELNSLTADEVVAVDINDALSGTSRDDQPELERTLPGTTGVIDIAGFLGALRRIGFDGPVRVEPISCAELEGMSARDKVSRTARAFAAVL